MEDKTGKKIWNHIKERFKCEAEAFAPNSVGSIVMAIKILLKVYSSVYIPIYLTRSNMIL